MQAVHAQFRRHRTLRLIRVNFCACRNFYLNAVKMIRPTESPYTKNGLIQIIRMDKFLVKKGLRCMNIFLQSEKTFVASCAVLWTTKPFHKGIYFKRNFVHEIAFSFFCTPPPPSLLIFWDQKIYFNLTGASTLKYRQTYWMTLIQRKNILYWKAAEHIFCHKC